MSWQWLTLDCNICSKFFNRCLNYLRCMYSWHHMASHWMSHLVLVMSLLSCYMSSHVSFSISSHVSCYISSHLSCYMSSHVSFCISSHVSCFISSYVSCYISSHVSCYISSHVSCWNSSHDSSYISSYVLLMYWHVTCDTLSQIWYKMSKVIHRWKLFAYKVAIATWNSYICR